jgi:NAD(P)H-dependent flavin oxidoreductase YrpB (nitropropane dioxygenase family)
VLCGGECGLAVVDRDQPACGEGEGRRRASARLRDRGQTGKGGDAITATLKTPICERFGIETPIFGFSHTVATVAAITNAGGFGVYGATRRFDHEIRDELNQIRDMVGSRPFGVDLVIPMHVPESNDRAAMEAQIPDAHRRFVTDMERRYEVPKATTPALRTRFIRSREIIDAQVAAVAETDVDLVALGIGSPPYVVELMKSKGKTTLALVGQEKHAERALAAGADILVAQGYDAGAHTGPVGTFSLVPRIVDMAGDVPVLAAGGVATGRHIAASLALGAQGVWIGTAFLLTEENAPHLSAGQIESLQRSGAADTVITRAESGKTFRQTRSGWSDEWAAPDAPTPLSHPLHDVLVGDLLGAIQEHDVKPLTHSGAGQGVGYFSEIRPTRAVVDDLAGEAMATIRRMRRELAE